MCTCRMSRFLLGFGLIVLLACGALTTVRAADSPNDRKPTDAKTISSPTSTSARPVPIEDLFYSRRVSSPAWSPDGTPDRLHHQPHWPG